MNSSARNALRLTRLLCVLLALAPGGFAQSPSPTPIDATQFGGKIDISQQWLFHPGNDPSWADASLNDTGWTLVSKKKRLSTYGFHNVREAWYRTHVHLRPDAHNVTVIADGVTDFAVFVNGQQIGQYGSLSDPTKTPNGRPPPMSIPDALIASSHGDVVIALHIFLGDFGRFGDPISAGVRFDLVTPQAAALEQSNALAHKVGWKLSFGELYLVVGLCALVLWLALRRQTEYLALAAWMLLQAFTSADGVWMEIHGPSAFGLSSLANVAANTLSLVAQMEFVRLITRTRRTRWLLGLELGICCMAVLLPLVNAGKLPLLFGVALFATPYLISAIFLPVLLIRSALRKNLDARLVLVPFILTAVQVYYAFLQIFAFFITHRVLPDWPAVHIGTYNIDISQFFDVIGILALLLIILTRNIRLARESAALGAEFAAAEQMQSLLLSRASHPTPGFAIDSIYLPASEVGGDFFHFSSSDDGSLLVVAGDVSGKGLRAAMAVSAVMGALRNEFSRSPATVLAHLNTTLCEHIDGFVTCTAALLAPDGAMRLANAGNPAPYRDGGELEVPTGLPLGITSAAEYEESASTLAIGQRLVFCSDGVIEATQPQTRELFGFERTAAISTQTATEIAHTAQKFGQTDDITVVSIQRLH